MKHGYRRSPTPLVPRAHTRVAEALTKREAAYMGVDSHEDVADCLNCEKEKCTNCKRTIANRKRKG